MEPTSLIEAIDYDAAGTIIKIIREQAKLKYPTISDHQIEIAKLYCINKDKPYLLRYFEKNT